MTSADPVFDAATQRAAMNEQIRALMEFDERELAELRSGEFPDVTRRRIARLALPMALISSVVAALLGVSALRLIQIALERDLRQLIAAVIFLVATGFLVFIARGRWRAIFNPELAQVIGRGRVDSVLASESNTTNGRRNRHYYIELDNLRLGLTRRQYNIIESGWMYRAWYLAGDRQLVAIEAIEG